MRLALLEAKRREEPILLDYGPSGPIEAINGTTKHFFRLIRELTSEFLDDPQAYNDLWKLSQAQTITGGHAQLFALARALALGPIMEPQPKE
ncbi:MAG TPA: hypothetical protein VIJ65_00235 [Acidobacteriaceae bacterium]